MKKPDISGWDAPGPHTLLLFANFIVVVFTALSTTHAIFISKNKCRLVCLWAYPLDAGLDYRESENFEGQVKPWSKLFAMHLNPFVVEQWFYVTGHIILLKVRECTTERSAVAQPYTE